MNVLGNWEDKCRGVNDSARKKKLSKLLDTTVGYLLGETEEVNHLKDPAMLKRLNEINSLPDEEKKSILLTVDAFLRGAKTRKAYA